jgi:hypothetical protein
VLSSVHGSLPVGALFITNSYLIFFVTPFSLRNSYTFFFFYCSLKQSIPFILAPNVL